ncbi:hypothetical protein A6770_24450 [Nostoc minutum NIES-26]|uniref:Uncharacterized protein n=1 Tax=Nostoc minutum NIES-26 TaxID=1844469 RepID=A0A367QWG2_9NOSO|nr:hypothetical protein [Dendronalium sp. ChiSLP03b]MDZ8206191.1 hypothetical protein [Dendronalium sp. ChiSLP03b]RCJ28041.1 hypothetical protein A6770_24450 [Nostoc minutum NIES-26]
MNKKLILNLISSSAIFTSLLSTLGVVHPAHAGTITQRLIHTNDGRTCISNPHGNMNFVCIKDSQRSANAPLPAKSMVISAQPSDSNVAELNFTDEESDMAIKLFACDCPYCINSLRQLRGTGNLVY